VGFIVTEDRNVMLVSPYLQSKYDGGVFSETIDGVEARSER
jgi:hypothetical protein